MQSFFRLPIYGHPKPGSCGHPLIESNTQKTAPFDESFYIEKPSEGEPDCPNYSYDYNPDTRTITGKFCGEDLVKTLSESEAELFRGKIREADRSNWFEIYDLFSGREK